MKPAAIAGTFSDFRIVRGRKVAQLVVEIPIEKSDEALAALGGVPQPAEERWVAVARLETNAAHKPPEAVRERRKWEDMSLAQQAAIRCSDERFQQFLADSFPIEVGDAGDAAILVRNICGIGSRTELNDNSEAAARWRALDNEFWAWQRGMH